MIYFYLTADVIQQCKGNHGTIVIASIQLLALAGQQNDKYDNCRYKYFSL